MSTALQTEKPQAEAQRGRFLSILTVLNAVAITLATIVIVFSRDLRRALGYLPDWFIPFLVAFLLARLAALGAMWKMKRWGAYAFLALECAEVAMGLFVFTAVLTYSVRALMAVPSFLILLGIWLLALTPKWRWFT